MNAKKILALMLCAMMLLSFAACGAKGSDTSTPPDDGSMQKNPAKEIKRATKKKTM